MSKQNSIARRVAHDRKLVELSDRELDTVAGGTTITKTVDAASPSLFKLCCTGKHFAS